MIYDTISVCHLAFLIMYIPYICVCVSLFVFQLAGLWFVLSVGSLAATINPSVSSIENTKLAPASSTLGAVYREARDYNPHDISGGGSGGGGGSSSGASSGNGYGNYRPYDRPQQRCISCLYAAMTGNQDRDR